MACTSTCFRAALTLVLAATLATGPALADKGGKGGKGGKNGGKEQSQQERPDKQSKQDKHDKYDGPRASQTAQHFGDPHRHAVRDYYGNQYKSGRCPPGLAKKNNGCMPPGQAKKWTMGRPLPRNVVFYEVPQPLVAQIGIPPPGHRYVRVAGDILMIAVGTSMVVDAIQDLGR